MEIVLLFALAGVTVWFRNRTHWLEQRVTDLEGAVSLGFARPTSPGPISRPRDAAPPQSEFEQEPATPPPSVSRPAPEFAMPDPVTEEPRADADALAQEKRRFLPGFDFEEIFGRLLPIWGGGVALAIAGFFLVRWSIEMGMLTRPVRVALGFGFGASLLIAAEFAYRFQHRIGDHRVRQALAGAGLATLYASFYLAGAHYGLIGPTAAFAGLAGITALAIAFSFRFGLPSAVLGLVGGFAAPALAGSTDANLPLLATYLALVTGGLTATGRRQRYPWLGLAALAGAFGWGALMLWTGPLDPGGILAVGGYLVLVGALLPSMLGAGPLGLLGRIAAAGLATLQIAALVDRSGYSLLAWGCYLLLGAAIAVLGTRFVRLREAGAVAAALSVCLLAAWPEAPGARFAAIAAASAMIFAVAPLFHVWRARAGDIDWAQLALYPIALVAAMCIQRGQPLLGSQDLSIAAGAFVLAMLPAFAAWRVWPSRDAEFATAPFAAFSSAIVTTILAGLLAVPEWGAPTIAAAAAIAVFVLLRGRAGAMCDTLRWSIAVAALVLLLATCGSREGAMLVGDGGGPRWLGALRWLAATLSFCLLLAESPNDGAARRFGEFFAALLAYGAASMLVPAIWLPFAIAVAVLGLAWRLPNCRSALVTLLALGGLWASGLLAGWAFAGIEALAGDPFLLGDLPLLSDTLRYIAPLAAGFGGAVILSSDFGTRRGRVGLLIAASLALVAAHVAFKQVFAIADMGRFIERGLAERTLWEGLLVFAACGLTTLWPRARALAPVGTGLGIVALGHFAVFGLLLHNPLWNEQAVGGWPIANLLPVSYGVAIGSILWLRGRDAEMSGRLRPIFDGAVMMLLTLFALSELRQAFSGSVLLGPVSQTEDLLRSMLAIAVALGFLGWGARTGQRSWRIGSLVLMLLAVFKVFIFDAAELEGLARIASFFALGICLIGIGWFYSRQLAKPKAEGETD